ncbi:MAG: DUF1850 domain-containing protein [Firmicutes bacterium]|nr:DUF1850 domain-containing protein [Bacillota bacterium]
MSGCVRTGHGAWLTRRQGGALAALALAVLVAAAAALVPAFEGLEVREWRTGRLLYFARMPAGSRFEVQFIHSVERTPVREILAAGPDLVIYLVETVYESFGAGLPTTADEGARLVLEDGKIRITGLHRRIGELVLSVSPVPGHALVVSGETVTLADLARPGTALSVKAVRAPVLAFLFRGRCWWMRR